MDSLKIDSLSFANRKEIEDIHCKSTKDCSFKIDNSKVKVERPWIQKTRYKKASLKNLSLLLKTSLILKAKLS